MSRGEGLWALCETRARVLQGAVGASARLARVLGLQPGMQIADIGAGSGALAVAMAPFVGSAGHVYATEVVPERRAAIERRVTRATLRSVNVVAATEASTRLADSCCEAVYMRAVFHHIADQPTFAADVARVLRPGGRVGILDFAQGTLWFHGADHGVQPDSVLSAFRAIGLRLRERVDDWRAVACFCLCSSATLRPNKPSESAGYGKGIPSGWSTARSGSGSRGPVLNHRNAGLNSWLAPRGSCGAAARPPVKS